MLLTEHNLAPGLVPGTRYWLPVHVLVKFQVMVLKKIILRENSFITPLIATVRWNKSPPPPLPIMSSSSEDGDASDANQFGMMM